VSLGSVVFPVASLRFFFALKVPYIPISMGTLIAVVVVGALMVGLKSQSTEMRGEEL